MKKIDVAVIMAGGKGSRLRSITNDEIPKPMVPVDGKPLLEYQVEALKEYGIKNIILTLGDKGSIFFSEDNNIKKYDVYKVKAVDTTAAGDSFIGAFTMKICETGNPDEAIKYATAVSAIVVTRQGAQDSIPTREEIEKFIEENK